VQSQSEFNLFCNILFKTAQFFGADLYFTRREEIVPMFCPKIVPPENVGIFLHIFVPNKVLYAS